MITPLFGSSGFLWDLHVHSRYSFDSTADPKRILDHAKNVGLAGVVFTEHHSIDSSSPLSDLRDPPVPFLRAVEFSTYEGHVLVYGVEKDEQIGYPRQGGPKAPLGWLIDQAQKYGWALVLPHPFRNKDHAVLRNTNGITPEIRSGFYDAGKTGGICGLEINSRCTPFENQQAIDAARNAHLPLTGGSDAHYESRVGRVRTVFESEIKTITDLITQLKKGAFTHQWHIHGNNIGQPGYAP